MVGWKKHGGRFIGGDGVLLPTGSRERGVLGIGSIPVAIPPSCQGMLFNKIP